MTGEDRAMMQHRMYIILANEGRAMMTSEIAAVEAGIPYEQFKAWRSREKPLLVRRVRNAMNILESKGMVTSGLSQGNLKERVWTIKKR